MSIISILKNAFTTIEDFVSNLFSSVKKDYQNLEPAAQVLFTGIIKWGNLIKGYIANPSSAGNLGFFIQLAETELGSVLMGTINSILGEILLDLQIVKTAITDPEAAYQALIDHLSQFSGVALGKELLKIISTIGEKVSGLETNEAVMIIAFVYKTFFQAAPVSNVPAIAQPVAVQTPIAEPCAIS